MREELEKERAGLGMPRLECVRQVGFRTLRIVVKNT